MKVLLTTLNAKYSHSSLALCNLAVYCRQDGLDVTVREYTINNELLHILSDIYGQRAQVIGLACYIWNIRMIMELVTLLKKVQPGIFIVLGGPEVSYDPEIVLSRCPAVDYVIMGEGEFSLSQLLACLGNKTENCAIPGVAWRHQGEIRVNGGPQVINQLDEIPFAYSSSLIGELQERIIYYESSRGCPFSCQYCLSSATKGVRFYSLQRVFADLAAFIAQNVRQVKFVDRTFNTRKEHYLPIIRFLAKQECRTNFHFEIAADLLDDEVIEALRSAPPGRFQLEIGVQSTYAPALEAICRNNDWEKITGNVAKLREISNIHLHLDLIVGLPFETLEQFSHSFNAVYSLQPHMLQIGFLKLLKGSGVRKTAAEHDYIYMDEAPYEVLGNRYLDYSEVRELQLIEDVFNQTYNSGRFSATLSWLVKDMFDGNAFQLYRSLSNYWQLKEMNMLSHNPKAIYEFLAAYCQVNFPAKTEQMYELLKFDALLSDNGRLKPEFLPWRCRHSETELGFFWRDEATVRNYLPDYVFTSWRDIKRNYQIELFFLDIPYYIRTGGLSAERTVLLFDYRSDAPTWLQMPGLPVEREIE